MANKTFTTVLPPLLAIDNGDGTYSIGVGEAYEWIERLLGIDRLLTATGLQYNVDDGDAVATTVQNTETDLYTLTLDNKGREAIIDFLTFGLTVALIQITGAVNGVYRWYFRAGVAGAWTKIYESGAIALGAAFVDYTVSGYWRPATDTNYPIQLKLTLETDGAANMGKGKIKNSSYCLVKAQ